MFTSDFLLTPDYFWMTVYVRYTSNQEPDSSVKFVSLVSNRFLLTLFFSIFPESPKIAYQATNFEIAINCSV